MVPALIVMTILGCDDSVSQCHYVSTVNGTWETVAKCDAESQKQLPKFSNSNYPVIVAVCETSDKQMAKVQDPAPLPAAQTELDQTHVVDAGSSSDAALDRTAATEPATPDTGAGLRCPARYVESCATP